MDQQTGELLVTEVIPRIRSMAQSLNPIASEDHNELIQDASVTSAHLLVSAKARAKPVSPGNIAYFAVALTRTGRRSYGYRKTDPLHPASQVIGRCRLVSLDESMRGDAEDDSAMCLHDVLAARVEDPSMAASRRLDWEQLFGTLDTIARAVLASLVIGEDLTRLAPKLGRSRSALQTDKERLARSVIEHFGPDVLAQSQQSPCWKNDLKATWEKLACRYERRGL